MLSYKGLHGTIQEYAKEREIDLTLFMTLLRKLDFNRIQFEKRIEDYSGGQKKKGMILVAVRSVNILSCSTMIMVGLNFKINSSI